MAFSRRLGVIGIFGASWLAAVACGDDEDKKTVRVSDGGEAGEATTGGKTSGGSSSGKGGTTAGMGGGGAGGMGVVGEGGHSGTGESVGGGGAAGESTGGAGAATGGAGGAGGAPAATALSCVYSCTIDDDCTINAEDTSHKCNPITKLCEDPLAVCETHADCLAGLTPWFGGCTTATECLDGETCVGFKGGGYCAALPDADFGCFPNVTVTMPLFDGGADVQVCGSADARCVAGACAYGCSFSGCPGGGGDTCNDATGLCECAAASECDSGVCGADGHCQQCVVDDDCAPTAAATGLDVCVDGKCSCSSVTACLAPPFDNATAVCE